MTVNPNTPNIYTEGEEDHPMKNILIIFLISFSSISILSKNEIHDYKVKTKANVNERTLMLDILRLQIQKEFKQDFLFIVNRFKVSGDYAWFQGDTKRVDGKKIVLPEDTPYDCCHVESLFKKTNGKWLIVEAQAFSTDVWWEDIETRYPKIPKGILK